MQEAQVLSTGEFWSVVSSAVSLLLGFSAIALSIYFFVAGRNTEKQVSNALTEIKAQTEMLQKITGKQLDRLTRYATTDRPDPSAEFTRLLFSFTAMHKQPLSKSIHSGDVGTDPEALKAELLNCYILIYYYAAVSNAWSQMCLPGPAEFDKDNGLHVVARNIVDGSCADFEFMARLLEKCDQQQLKSGPFSALLAEARDHWRGWVRDSSAVFVERSQGGESPE